MTNKDELLLDAGAAENRRGCCATGGQTGLMSAATAIDPVCGMKVDASTSQASSMHDGETFYFCALGCKKACDKQPAQYLLSAG